MKIKKIANKQKIIISKKEWESIGRQAGWMEDAEELQLTPEQTLEYRNECQKELLDYLYKKKKKIEEKAKNNPGLEYLKNMAEQFSPEEEFEDLANRGIFSVPEYIYEINETERQEDEKESRK
jgi:2-iminoacetate synthase ThiH